ncbi:MAG: RimK/LysX family protein [Candidatus Hydrogenedentota bacterium]
MHGEPQEQSKDTSSKTIIGWSEYVAFPEWGIDRVPAKVDTGARTSSLHVDNLEVLDDHYVRFEVVLSRRHSHKRVHVTAPVLKWGRVRSSTGHYHTRCFVKTRIRIGPVEKEIELSLASRERMLYRMLLGRKALEKDFLVDVSKRRTLGKPKKARRKTKRLP